MCLLCVIKLVTMILNSYSNLRLVISIFLEFRLRVNCCKMSGLSINVKDEDSLHIIDCPPEETLEDLKFELNEIVSFKKEISKQDQVRDESEANFKIAVNVLARNLELFIDSHPEIATENLETEIKLQLEKGEIFDKNLLKNAMKDVIGNKLNVDNKTESNHEFKVCYNFF